MAGLPGIERTTGHGALESEVKVFFASLLLAGACAVSGCVEHHFTAMAIHNIDVSGLELGEEATGSD
jgi:hypothetical protein